MSRMWPLSAFRHDEGIVAAEVYVYSDASGELELVSRDEAIDAARSQGKHLIACWPGEDDDDIPSCVVGRLALPLRWEQVPDGGDAPELDDRLWFHASCGGRDLLLDGQGHTFHGRMSAWCPRKAVAYNVSLDEMGEMSVESRYFVMGFLSGNEPGPPEDEEGNADPADMAAWRSATRRFRQSGSWYGRWGTCDECGCVLLPDSASKRCQEHSTEGNATRGHGQSTDESR